MIRRWTAAFGISAGSLVILAVYWGAVEFIRDYGGSMR